MPTRSPRMLVPGGWFVSAALALISPAYAQLNPALPLPGLSGQPKSGPPAIKLALTGTQKNWTKVCGKDQAAEKSVCYTTRDFSAEVGKPPLVAFAVYDITGVDTKIVRLLLPIGLSLPPGIRIAIDGGAPNNGFFSVCFPKGCFAEAKVSAAVVVGMKRGTILNIGVRNPTNAEVTFAVPLEGFGKAFDGPAIDPKILQAEQQKLQKKLQDAEDQRKKAAPSGATAPPGSTK